MISDVPDSYYEYVMPSEELSKRAIYNLIILPWNVTCIDLYEICKNRPNDFAIKEVLRRAYDVRQMLIDMYNLNDIENHFEDVLDHQGIHDYLTFD